MVSAESLKFIRTRSASFRILEFCLLTELFCFRFRGIGRLWDAVGPFSVEVTDNQFQMVSFKFLTHNQTEVPKLLYFVLPFLTKQFRGQLRKNKNTSSPSMSFIIVTKTLS